MITTFIEAVQTLAGLTGAAIETFENFSAVAAAVVVAMALPIIIIKGLFTKRS